MKKCDQFKELILTDYIDGESDQARRNDLEGHCKDCSDCRAFLKEVKNNALLPFQKVLSQPVPAELWERISGNLDESRQARDPVGEFLENLKAWMVFPRLAPVFASVLLMFLIGSVTFNNFRAQQAKAMDQGQYLVSILSPAVTAGQGDGNDPGTAIEHYFL